MNSTPRQPSLHTVRAFNKFIERLPIGWKPKTDDGDSYLRFYSVDERGGVQRIPALPLEIGRRDVAIDTMIFAAAVWCARYLPPAVIVASEAWIFHLEDSNYQRMRRDLGSTPDLQHDENRQLLTARYGATFTDSFIIYGELRGAEEVFKRFTKGSWFMQILLPRLRFRSSMEEREAVEILALEASAPPDYKRQLVMLLEYGAAVGLFTRESGMLTLNQQAASAAQSQDQEEEPTNPPPPTVTPPTPAPQSPLAGAMFAPNANGAVQFNFSVHVNQTELATWTADRIAAFFSGIAQVLAARGKAED
jgi:hypothetical protein